VSKAAALIRALAGVALLAMLRVYRWIMSPMFYALGARCRFHPSCSVYAEECVRHYGPWRGSVRAARRLLKCHPFHPGGYDPPIPERQTAQNG
jgi:uncharacterized protein